MYLNLSIVQKKGTLAHRAAQLRSLLHFSLRAGSRALCRCACCRGIVLVRVNLLKLRVQRVWMGHCAHKTSTVILFAKKTKTSYQSTASDMLQWVQCTRCVNRKHSKTLKHKNKGPPIQSYYVELSEIVSSEGCHQPALGPLGYIGIWHAFCKNGGVLSLHKEP